MYLCTTYPTDLFAHYLFSSYFACRLFGLTRPTLSQFWNLKVRRKTFLVYIRFIDLLILRYSNCERAGQAFQDVIKHRPRVLR